MTRHGAPTPLTPEQALAYMTGDDPRLALVHADMTAYAQSHPCGCGGCGCESRSMADCKCEVCP